MLDVHGRSGLRSPPGADKRLSEAPTVNAAQVGRWLTLSGLGVIVLSVFGGVFPYFANGLGLPLDGAPDGVMTTWRTVLHLIPGAVGVAAGVVMVLWGRRRRAGQIVDPMLGRSTGRATLAVGAWFAVGPYLYGIIAPSQAHGTGGHAGMVTVHGMSWLSNAMMPMFGTMTVIPTTANCALTMGICHWAVGGAIVFAGLVAMGAGLAMGPLAGLSRAGTAEDLS